MASAISAKFLESVPRGDSEVFKLFARIDLDKLSPGCPLHLDGPSPHRLSCEEPLRVPIGERFYHAPYSNATR